MVASGCVHASRSKASAGGEVMPQVVCDGNGFVRGFPYHDGRLDGVLVSDCGTEVCLALRDTADGRRVLTLRHVSALHVDGFRQGNIVLNLRTVPADQAGRPTAFGRFRHVTALSQLQLRHSPAPSRRPPRLSVGASGQWYHLAVERVREVGT
jgi:hypothetical protein